MGDHFFTATALDVAMPHLPDFLSALPAVLQVLDEHPLGGAGSAFSGGLLLHRKTPQMTRGCCK